MFDFSVVTTWLHSLLSGWMGDSLAILVECVLVALVIITIYAIFAIIMIYAERKVCAAFQCRIGPDRVGKWGLLQVISDVLKMMTKEVINFRKTDQFLHRIAPFLVVTASMVTFACLPWNKGAQIIDFNVGVFFFLACGSVGIRRHSLWPVGRRTISLPLSVRCVPVRKSFLTSCRSAS